MLLWKKYGLTHSIQLITAVLLHIQFLWALIKQYPLRSFLISDDGVLQLWHWSALQSYPFFCLSPSFFFSISNSAFVGYWLCPATTHTRNVYFQLLYIIYFLMSLYKFLPHHLEPVWRLDICEKLFRDHFWKSKWLWQPVLSAVGTHLMRAPFRHSWLVISIFLFWNKSGNIEMNSFYFCL